MNDQACAHLSLHVDVSGNSHTDAMVTSATVRGGGHVGWAGSGLGGLVGVFTVAWRRVPNSAPRPTPIEPHYLTFPGLCLPPKFARAPGANTTLSPFPLPSSRSSLGCPTSGKVIRFKGRGLKTKGGGEGKWGRRKGREGIQQDRHHPFPNTRMCSCSEGSRCLL